MRRILAILAAFATLLGLGAIAAPLMVQAASTSGPTKTVVIWEENRALSQVVGDPDLPYLNSLASDYATYNEGPNFDPSLPNYLEDVFGNDFGVRDDGPPGSSKHPASMPGPTIYDVVPGALDFDESMPSNCFGANAGTDNGTDGVYLVHHNPWPYETGTTGCKSRDLPYRRSTESNGGGNLKAALDAGLPAFTSITPGACNEFHSQKSPACQSGNLNQRADDYLHWLVPFLEAGPDYQAGKLAIWVVFDQGSDADNNNTLATVVSPQSKGVGRLSGQKSRAQALATWQDTAGVDPAQWIGDSQGATSLYGDLFNATPPSSPPPSSPPPSSPPPSSPPPSGPLKHTAQGLMDRQGSPKVTTVNDYVVNFNWSDIEPTRGGFDFSKIDAALAGLPSGYAAKLRISAGEFAPDWVFSDAGTFQITDISQSSTGSKITVPKFWTQPYMDDWAGLQQALAARYDSDARVGVVTSNPCVMEFDEPYLRDTSGQGNAQALVDAGFTVQADNACHDAEMTVPLAAWHQTKVEITFNPYQSVDSSASVHQDLAYTLAQMDQWKSLGGNQAELANYSLSVSKIGSSDYGQIYDKIKAYGPPSSIQTATNAKIGDPNTVLQYACDTLKVNSVELPSGYNQWTGVDFAAWDRCLRANPDPTDASSPAPSPSPSPSESPSPSPSESPSPSPTGSPSESPSPSPSESSPPPPPPAGDPAVTTADVSEITDTSATVTCSVDPDGADTDLWLNYKLDSGAWGDASTVNSPHETVLASDGATSIDFEVDGLAAQTAYAARCKASNSASDADGHSPVVGGVVTFTTNPAPTDPTVTTGSVDAVEVLCPVNPGGADTLVWVVWKLTSDPWSSTTTTHTSAQSVLGSQAKAYAVPFWLTSLPAASSIDYRCKASNSVSDADGHTPIVGDTQTIVTP